MKRRKDMKNTSNGAKWVRELVTDTMDQFKKQAKQGVEQRGHRLGDWNDISPSNATATCRYCQKEVQVLLNPAPNETHIAGPACGLNCHPLEVRKAINVAIRRAIRGRNAHSVVTTSDGGYQILTDYNQEQAEKLGLKTLFRAHFTDYLDSTGK
jgi:hypothetical protein